MTQEERPLLIEPVVGWLPEVEPGLVQCVSVDLRGPLDDRGETDADAWPYDEEELAFSASLDGSPYFVCEVLDDPGLVLHRFGGTYGPATFLVTAGPSTGHAVLRLTIFNQWGATVRKAELPCVITEPAESGGRLPAARSIPGAPAGGAGPDDPGDGAGGNGGGHGWPGTSAPAPGRRDARPGRPAPPGRLDSSITVSFAGFDRAWAAWIADRLERRGVTLIHQRWDPPAELPLTEALTDLTFSPGRVLILLSDWYFQLGPRSHEEWNRALRAVVAPDPDRFAAVSITTSALPGATSVFAAPDLTGVGADEAERRLLAGLGLPTDPLPAHDASLPGPRFPADVPEVWSGVPRRNTRFTGREELLASVYGTLRAGGPRHDSVTLHGMSGVGKTHLAAEYVYRFGSEYDVVWWVPADRRALYRQRLAELAPELGLSTGAEYGERLRAVRDALRRGEPHRHWLLVLDGADEPDQIWDLVPTGPGHVLITSRNPEWSEHNSNLVEVPVYERDESVAFIRRRAPRLTHTEADRLAGALEDLPLLLDQTAGWLNDSDMSVEEYIELLGGGLDQDVIKVSADFPLAFQTAWSILLNKLRETVPESVDLLRLCSFFAPGSIPVRLLKAIPLDELPERLRGRMNDRLGWDRAIHQLRQYSVVRVEAHESVAGDLTSGESIYLHRMVHQIVRKDMPERERPVFAEGARRALAAADPGDPSETTRWPVYAALTPHLEWAEILDGTDAAVHQLALNCLRYMYLSGEYGSGVRFARPAMDSWEALLGPADPRIWALRHHYANLLRALGDYRGSESVERATADFLAVERGELDLDHLRAAGGLAADLRGLGRYQEALDLSASILERDRRLLGPEDSRTLNAENNLAVSLRLLGRYEEARQQDERTLALRRSVLAPNAPPTLYSEINLAMDLRLLGRHREAELALRETVGRHLRGMGGNNPQTLRAQYHLTLCQYALEGAVSALPALAATRQSALRLLGEDDPLTLLITTAVATAEREAGEPRQALELHEHVANGYRRMLGDRHPYTIGVEGNLGLMHWSLGDRDLGSQRVERARTAMAGAVGEEHPWTIGCAMNTVVVRARTGRLGAARELGRVTCERANATLTSRHPLSVACYAAIATRPAEGDPVFWPFEPLII
ncbi:FxSxx-COOH system tetratricopeptide repeat protein [Streptomyces sp. NBC_01220]|uniref:FxSxx-COOH system tetratricopeptide repeat protein n=1 Tax=Streptomyces sp. NBC_01220 TaxID=2903781 RepID=UPI00352FD1EB|nr:FxSxx-COOH system tetratricopeptide repeat protein [Streptomyces sp. NBC_01220]